MAGRGKKQGAKSPLDTRLARRDSGAEIDDTTSVASDVISNSVEKGVFSDAKEASEWFREHCPPNLILLFQPGDVHFLLMLSVGANLEFGPLKKRYKYEEWYRAVDIMTGIEYTVPATWAFLDADVGTREFPHVCAVACLQTISKPLPDGTTRNVKIIKISAPLADDQLPGDAIRERLAAIRDFYL